VDVRPRQKVTLAVNRKDGSQNEIELTLRIDTAIELEYFKNGGILPFVLRQLASM
jgi:aconitate hydratase